MLFQHAFNDVVVITLVFMSVFCRQQQVQTSCRRRCIWKTGRYQTFFYFVNTSWYSQYMYFIVSGYIGLHHVSKQYLDFQNSSFKLQEFILIIFSGQNRQTFRNNITSAFTLRTLSPTLFDFQQQQQKQCTCNLCSPVDCWQLRE